MSIDPNTSASDSQRGEAYWFLAHLFAQPLDEQSIHRLTTMAAANTEEHTEFTDDILAAFRKSQPVDSLAQRLAMEHTRLFRGINEHYGPPPPYESLWREGCMMGESTLRVAQHYLEAGYQPDGTLTPLDHLAEELRFMANLCHAEETAGSTDTILSLRHRQRRFINEHLGIWVNDYCRRIAEQTREPLYSALALTTSTIIAQDAAYLGTESGEAHV